MCKNISFDSFVKLLNKIPASSRDEVAQLAYDAIKNKLNKIVEEYQEIYTFFGALNELNNELNSCEESKIVAEEQSVINNEDTASSGNEAEAISNPEAEIGDNPTDEAEDEPVSETEVFSNPETEIGDNPTDKAEAEITGSLEIVLEHAKGVNPNLSDEELLKMISEILRNKSTLKAEDPNNEE